MMLPASKLNVCPVGHLFVLSRRLLQAQIQALRDGQRSIRRI